MSKKQPKARQKLGRTNQVKTRLTDEELKLFEERVKSSGMKQGDFLRECILHENINIRSVTEIDGQALGLLMEMSSELGRIGGMVKGTVIKNKEFQILSESEKNLLEKEIKELNKLKEEIQKVVQSIYGNN